MKYAIVQWVGDRRIATHFVDTPTVGEDGFYREVTSVSCFHNRESQRFHKAYMGRRVKGFKWFHVQMWPDWEMYLHSCKLVEEATGKPFDPYQGGPTVEHKNIWDFYNAVRYDRKRQRLLRDDEDFL